MLTEKQIRILKEDLKRLEALIASENREQILACVEDIKTVVSDENFE